MIEPENQKPPVKACPICGKPASDQAAPFCSYRCANIDLGRWLGEKYALPAEEDDEDEAPVLPPDSETSR